MGRFVNKWRGSDPSANYDRFLVESTKIKNTSFPYKTAISEANVKTNRIVSTTWTYHEERSFASNYFEKIFFSLTL